MARSAEDGSDDKDDDDGADNNDDNSEDDGADDSDDNSDDSDRGMWNTRKRPRFTTASGETVASGEMVAAAPSVSSTASSRGRIAGINIFIINIIIVIIITGEYRNLKKTKQSVPSGIDGTSWFGGDAACAPRIGGDRPTDRACVRAYPRAACNNNSDNNNRGDSMCDPACELDHHMSVQLSWNQEYPPF